MTRRVIRRKQKSNVSENKKLEETSENQPLAEDIGVTGEGNESSEEIETCQQKYIDPKASSRTIQTSINNITTKVTLKFSNKKPSHGEKEEIVKENKEEDQNRHNRRTNTVKTDITETTTGAGLASAEHPVENVSDSNEISCRKKNIENNITFPLSVGSVLTVLNLGRVEHERINYHNERHIFPIGYKSERMYNSYKDVNKKIQYICEILDDGESPLFKVTPSDDPDVHYSSNTPTGSWTPIIKKVQECRMKIKPSDKRHTSSVSGPEYFGLSNSKIKHLIEQLPNASKCSNYMQHTTPTTSSPVSSPGLSSTLSPASKRRKKGKSGTSNNQSQIDNEEYVEKDESVPVEDGDSTKENVHALRPRRARRKSKLIHQFEESEELEENLTSLFPTEGEETATNAHVTKKSKRKAQLTQNSPSLSRKKKATPVPPPEYFGLDPSHPLPTLKSFQYRCLSNHIAAYDGNEGFDSLNLYSYDQQFYNINPNKEIQGELQKEQKLETLQTKSPINNGTIYGEDSAKVQVMLKENEEEKKREQSDEKEKTDLLSSMWEFAYVCYLCGLVRPVLKIVEFEPEDLEDAFLHPERNNGMLADIHIKLVKGPAIDKKGISYLHPKSHYWMTVVKNKIDKIPNIYKCWDVNPLDRHSYEELSPIWRVLVLKAIIDWKIEHTSRVSEYLKKNYDETLRFFPIGKDRFNNLIWYLGPEMHCLFKETLVKPKVGDPLKTSPNDGLTEKKGQWSLIADSLSSIMEYTEELSRSEDINEQQLFMILTDSIIPILKEHMSKCGQLASVKSWHSPLSSSKRYKLRSKRGKSKSNKEEIPQEQDEVNDEVVDQNCLLSKEEQIERRRNKRESELLERAEKIETSNASPAQSGSIDEYSLNTQGSEMISSKIEDIDMMTDLQSTEEILENTTQEVMKTIPSQEFQFTKPATRSTIAAATSVLANSDISLPTSTNESHIMDSPNQNEALLRRQTRRQHRYKEDKMQEDDGIQSRRTSRGRVVKQRSFTEFVSFDEDEEKEGGEQTLSKASRKLIDDDEDFTKDRARKKKRKNEDKDDDDDEFVLEDEEDEYSEEEEENPSEDEEEGEEEETGVGESTNFKRKRNINWSNFKVAPSMLAMLNMMTQRQQQPQSRIELPQGTNFNFFNPFKSSNQSLPPLPSTNAQIGSTIPSNLSQYLQFSASSSNIHKQPQQANSMGTPISTDITFGTILNTLAKLGPTNNQANMTKLASFDQKLNQNTNSGFSNQQVPPLNANLLNSLFQMSNQKMTNQQSNEQIPQQKNTTQAPQQQQLNTQNNALLTTNNNMLQLQGLFNSNINNVVTSIPSTSTIKKTPELTTATVPMMRFDSNAKMNQSNSSLPDTTIGTPASNNQTNHHLSSQNPPNDPTSGQNNDQSQEFLNLNEKNSVDSTEPQ